MSLSTPAMSLSARAYTHDWCRLTHTGARVFYTESHLFNLLLLHDREQAWQAQWPYLAAAPFFISP